jgi:hypothetical protein
MLDQYAISGLRTLVYGKKIISQEDFNLFSLYYNQAKNNLEDREFQLNKV